MLSYPTISPCWIVVEYCGKTQFDYSSITLQQQSGDIQWRLEGTFILVTIDDYLSNHSLEA